jgi:hypothetical protein
LLSVTTRVAPMRTAMAMGTLISMFHRQEAYWVRIPPRISPVADPAPETPVHAERAGPLAGLGEGDGDERQGGRRHQRTRALFACYTRKPGTARHRADAPARHCPAPAGCALRYAPTAAQEAKPQVSET